MPNEVRKRSLSLVHSAADIATPEVQAPSAAEIKASRDALEEMQALLRIVASSSTPVRLSAVDYTRCRAILLEGPLRPGLPGFVLQCVSIFKFHEFINLYDARPQVRLAFIEDAFGNTGPGPKAKPTYDVFNDPDF